MTRSWWVAGLLTFALVAAACSDEDSSDSTSPSSPADAAGADGGDQATSRDASADFTAVVERRLGEGRAEVAAGSAASGSVVVGTTLGAAIVDPDGTIAAIERGAISPVVDVAVVPDGSVSALLAETGELELWALEPVASQIATVPLGDPVGASVVATADGWFVVETADRLTWVGVDGSEAASFEREPDERIGEVDWSPDASWAALVIASAAAATEVVVTNGSETRRVDPALDASIVRAVPLPTLDQVVVSAVPNDDQFGGVLAAIDLATGAPVWSSDVGDVVLAETWDVLGDGTVVIASEGAIERVAADGSTSRIGALESVVPPSPLESAPGPPRAIGPATLRSLATTADGDAIRVVTTDGRIAWVDGAGAVLGSVAGTGSSLADVTEVAIDGDAGAGAGSVVVDVDGRVRWWDPSGTAVVEVDALVAGEVNEVAFDVAGEQVARAASHGAVTVTTLAPVDADELLLDHPEGNVDAVAFAPDGSRVVTGLGERLGPISFDDTVSGWDLDTASRGFRIGGDGEEVAGCAQFRNVVAYSPDGSMIAVNSHDFTVSLLDAEDGTLLHTFEPHLSTVLDLAFSPDGSRLATSSDAGMGRLWDVEGRSQISEYQAAPGGYWTLQFTPDGSQLVTGDVSGTIRVIDAVDGSEVSVLAGAKNRTGDLAVSPDGRHVAAGDEGSDVVVWSLETGVEVTRLDGHTGSVTTVAFSPDGARMASGSADGTVLVWTLPV